MEAGSRDARRKIAIILLKSVGGMVTRTGNVRKCNECLEEISENVFIHRITKCKMFDKKREKIPLHIHNIAALPNDRKVLYVQRKVMECDFSLIYF